MVTLTNIVDGAGLYFLALGLIIAAAFYRDATFQSYVKNFYKNYISFSNFLPFHLYISFFFNNFLNSISYLTNVFYNFFKTKK